MEIQFTGLEPRRASEGAAGFDLVIDHFISIDGSEAFVGTGLSVALPENHVGLVCLRSSLGKEGWSIPNAPGIIDADYRGEIKVLLRGHVGISRIRAGDGLKVGDRIAQLVILPLPQVKFVKVDQLPPTTRGHGGFGSTGKC